MRFFYAPLPQLINRLLTVSASLTSFNEFNKCCAYCVVADVFTLLQNHVYKYPQHICNALYKNYLHVRVALLHIFTFVNKTANH